MLPDNEAQGRLGALGSPSLHEHKRDAGHGRAGARANHWMEQAIATARAGIAAGQSPFGAVIVAQEVAQGRVVAASHNQVWATLDPTAHAEVGAIRLAAAKRQNIDLSGCVIYSTCEPCPMCMAAIHWARIDAVVYGASIADAAAAGFNELRVPAQTLIEQGGSRVRLEGGCLAEVCRGLFDEWRAAERGRAY